MGGGVPSFSATFEHGGHVYFLADGENSFEVPNDVLSPIVPGDFGLWRTDGTEQGTVSMTSLLPGVLRIESAVDLDGRVLLTLENSSGRELWTFDGTPEGTFRLADGPANDPLIFNNQLFFLTSSAELANELHVTDGTLAGTERVFELPDGPEEVAANLFDVGNHVIFKSSSDGSNLWMTDGTTEGTEVVTEANVGQAMVSGDNLYFTTSAGLYRYDDPSQSVLQVLEATQEINLTVATDARLVFEVGEESYSIGNEMDAAQIFEAPAGEIIYSDGRQIIYAERRVDPTELEPENTTADLVTQLWWTDGTNAGTRVFAEPILHEQFLPIELADLPDFDFRASIVSTQLIDDQLIVRIAADDFGTDLLHVTAYSFELDGNPDVVLAGDADQNGEVGFSDFLLLSANFGKTDAVFADGDFNGDNMVNFADFLLLSMNFGATFE